MSSELLVYAEERLFEAGALDVYKTPIIMKKGRPAIKLSVLVSAELIEGVERTLFTETTAIGLRKYPIDKVKLHREYETYQTSLGPVVLKSAYIGGDLVNKKLEYEQCRKIALEQKIPIKRVYEIIENELNNGKDYK